MFTAANFTTLLTSLSLAPAGDKPLPPPSSFLAQSFLQTSADSCSVAPYAHQQIPIPTFAPFDRQHATIYRYRKQQSVNLGSWFVQENWMVPSLFTCAADARAGEHDVAAGWGNTTASRQIIERHWDTWIQDSDFAYLQSIGINTVRLPIGFWSLGPEYCVGTPFEDVKNVYEQSWPRVLRAIKSAEGYGIGVLIDLHGAPGSQNGQSHSGMSDGKIDLFNNPSYVNKTIDVLTFLTTQLVQINNVVGIQLLNEPKNFAGLPAFYERTLSVLRGVSDEANRFPFYIHDGFNLAEYRDFISNRTDFLVEDHHSYFVYTASDTAETATNHTKDVKTTIFNSFKTAADKERQNLVIDEWSCSLTSQSLAHESDPGAAQREFCTGQMNSYASSSAGWSFWSYYLEDCATDDGWCFKQAVGRSLPSTFFSFPEMAQTPRNPLAPMGDANAVALGNLDGNVTIAQIVALALSNDTDISASPSTSTVNGFTSNVQSTTRTRALVSRMSARRHQAIIDIYRRDRLRHRARNNTASAIPDFFNAPYDRFAHMSAQQVATSRGYEDGFDTAKIFAQFGMSRLGFSGQYVADTVAVHIAAGQVQKGQVAIYTTWFLKGLRDGEAQAVQAITNAPAVYPPP